MAGFVGNDAFENRAAGITSGLRRGAFRSPDSRRPRPSDDSRIDRQRHGGGVVIDRVLVRKYIGQSALLWSACGLALFAFAWVRVWVVGLLDMSQFQSVLDLFKDFEKFAPIEFSALATYAGRIGMTFDEPIVILCTVIWCVARGSDVVSGELSRGTLEMLLAQPVSRARLMLSHATVSVVGLALLCLLLWAGIGVGIEASTVKETVPPPSFRIPLIGIDVPLSGADPVVEIVPMTQRVDAATF